MDLQARGPARGYYPEPVQKYFVRGLWECSPGRGALSGAGDQSGNRAPLPGWLHWGQGGRGEVVGGEDQGVDRVSGYPRWGFLK